MSREGLPSTDCRQLPDPPAFLHRREKSTQGRIPERLPERDSWASRRGELTGATWGGGGGNRGARREGGIRPGYGWYANCEELNAAGNGTVKNQRFHPNQQLSSLSPSATARQFFGNAGPSSRGGGVEAALQYVRMWYRLKRNAIVLRILFP